MNSLKELKEFFQSEGIEITSYNGWQLKVNKDLWMMSHDVFYLNGEPQNVKKKDFIKNYIQKVDKNDNISVESNQTRKWRGISCRGRVRT